jgi:hypothetical protein
MSAACLDLERALRGDDPALTEAWRRHAESCPACAEERAFWDDVHAAAPSLRKDWPSPALRGRILRRLEEEARRPRLASWSWLPLAAAACLLLVFLIRPFLPSPRPSPSPAGAPLIDAAQQRLLTERALAEVEQAEAAYMRSIEALSRVAEPHLQHAHSPLLANYREKLLLLDTAIATCRDQVERNRFNAHLRLELLSIYQEKQRTLQSLLKEDPHAL